MLAMVWFTFIVTVFLSWLTVEAGSVWPAVIGHAAINGFVATGKLVTLGQPSPLLGPMAVGIIGSLPFALLAFWLLWRSPVFSEHQVPAQLPSSPVKPVHHAA